MHRVAITGCGIVSPIGNTVPEFERRMFAGESGIQDIRGRLVAANFPVPFAGVVNEEDLVLPAGLALDAKPSSKALRYSLVATDQAMGALPQGSALDAIVFGTPGGIYFELVAETFREFDMDSYPWAHTRAETLLERIAARLEAAGYQVPSAAKLLSLNTACATGIHAIGLGFERIRSGRWTRCLVGGVDSGAWASSLMNFHLLNALTTADVPASEASRPFSLDRSGFVKGEGAAALLLESFEAATSRGAEILAEVCGFGFTSDAYRLTDGRDDNRCTVKAMQEAIATAGLTADDIDYVNAHGTSTPQNDRLETLALKKVFGVRAYQVPVSSLKSQIGHPTIASGAVETIACVLMLRRQRLAPTINLKVPDPECDLDYVSEGSRDANVRYILNNAFGFGGQNACLVVGRFD